MKQARQIAAQAIATAQAKPAAHAEVAALAEFIPAKITVAEFVRRFRAGQETEDTGRQFWLDMSMIAPLTFGANCYVKNSDDYDAMRTHLEAAYEMPDAPERSDKTPHADAVRAKRKSISTMLSVYISRMASYAFPTEAAAAKVLTLQEWAVRALLQVHGRGKVMKDGKQVKPAIKPSIKGIAPLELVEMLQRLSNPEATTAPAAPVKAPAKQRKVIAAPAALVSDKLPATV